jgi:hypothetical protein
VFGLILLTLVMEFLPEPKCQLLGILDLKVIDMISPMNENPMRVHRLFHG